MPNIKLNRPFGIAPNGEQVLKNVPYICYKCGKEIPIGSYDWTYHTQTKGLWSHRSCVAKVIDIPQAAYGQKPSVQETPKPVETPVVEPQKPLEPIKLPEPVQEVKPIEQVAGESLYHKCYHKLKAYALASVKRNLYIPGAPGSGKSYAIKQLAEELGYGYVCVPLSEVTTPADLLGFDSVDGSRVIKTEFRRAYTSDNMILDFPEMDNVSANTMATINNALDNGHCPFPDGLLRRGKNMFVIGNGNTDLRGPTDQFPERRKQDAATIDRFTFVPWDYDETLEMLFCGKTPELQEMVLWCHKLRRLIKDKAVEAIIGFRVIVEACNGVAAGIPALEVLQNVVLKCHPQSGELLELLFGRKVI